MAFDVSSLPAYTNEDELSMLVRSLYTPKTASILDGAGQILRDIKTAKALPILESTVYLQADACGNTTSGATTITQRTLTVAKAKVFEDLCPVTLETKFTQKGLNAGHPEDLGQFMTQIGEEKSATIADKIEQVMWTGATSNAGEWDGFCTILTALGFGGAGDPVEGNPTTGGGWTQLTSLTSSNIDEAIEKIYSLIPARVLDKGDVVCFMGADAFRLALLNLKAANLYHYTPEAATDMTLVWPGTTLKLIGVPGLNGTSKLVAGRLTNFFAGTDLMNEEDQFKMWYSQDLDVVKFKATFKYGVQIAFPAETVYFVI